MERPSGFLIVSVGRLVPWKGMDGIIRAVAEEKEWQACIVGAGPDDKKLSMLTRKFGCADRVHFTGELARAQALGWVKTADAFVLNSTYEGLSHQLIEAMSLGIPIVATNIGGNPELITDGKEGLLIEPGDDEALRASLRWIEGHRRGARTLGTRAALRAKEFSIEKTLDQFSALLKTI